MKSNNQNDFLLVNFKHVSCVKICYCLTFEHVWFKSDFFLIVVVLYCFGLFLLFWKSCEDVILTQTISMFSLIGAPSVIMCHPIWDYSFSTYAKFSEKLIFLTPLIRTRTCKYRKINVSFSENFAYVLNEWSHCHQSRLKPEFIKTN